MLRTFDLAGITPAPWKNGGGVTRELASWPSGATLETFEWRVSVASITASGPFSSFDGVDRVIMVLDGDGVRLRAADGSIDHVLATPYAPFAFSGGAAIDCELIGGPSRDLNVMIRRNARRAHIEIVRNSTRLARCAHGLLLAPTTPWSVSDVAPLRLDAGCGVCWAEELHAWTVEPHTEGGVLIAIRIE